MTRCFWHLLVGILFVDNRNGAWALSIYFPCDLTLALANDLTEFEASSFTSECPTNRLVRGFPTMEELVCFVEQETLTTVFQGFDLRQAPYIYRLCPNTVYDMDVSLILYPVLSDSRFVCGNDGRSGDNCVLSTDLAHAYLRPNPPEIDSPMKVRFEGITFRGAAVASILAFAESSGIAEFIDCRWENNPGNPIALRAPDPEDLIRRRRQVEGGGDPMQRYLEERRLREKSLESLLKLYGSNRQLQMSATELSFDPEAMSLDTFVNATYSFHETSIEKKSEQRYDRELSGIDFSAMNVEVQSCTFSQSQDFDLFCNGGGSLRVYDSSFETISTASIGSSSCTLTVGGSTFSGLPGLAYLNLRNTIGEVRNSEFSALSQTSFSIFQLGGDLLVDGCRFLDTFVLGAEILTGVGGDLVVRNSCFSRSGQSAFAFPDASIFVANDGSLLREARNNFGSGIVGNLCDDIALERPNGVGSCVSVAVACEAECSSFDSPVCVGVTPTERPTAEPSSSPTPIPTMTMVAGTTMPSPSPTGRTQAPTLQPTSASISRYDMWAGPIQVFAAGTAAILLIF